MAKVSAQRKALYAENDLDKDTIKRFESDLSNPVKLGILRKWYKVTVASDEQAKDEILALHFQSVKKNASNEQDAILANALARDKYHAKFFEIFRVPLNRYWGGNVLGFDALKFDAEVVKSGDQSVYDAANSKWGPDAVEVLKGLVGSA